MTTLADLTPSQLADLYQQVGDAMYNPGFNYDAHIQGNTFNGVFVAPTNNPTTGTSSPGVTGGHGFTPVVAVPTNTANLLTIPTVGTPEYQKLLEETGGASANPGFNYAAHLAAIVSQSRGDMSYNDVMLVIAETGTVNFDSFDLATYRTATGSKVGLDNVYANNVIAQTAVGQIEKNVFLAMTEVGSAEYTRLLDETGGASANPDFNYLAHVAAITSQKVLTSLSYAEVITLVAETGIANFEGFDLVGYQQQKHQADVLLSRVLPSEVSQSEMPQPGTAAYQDILNATGLTDLTGFDYQSYLQGLHQAHIASVTVQGTGTDDTLQESSAAAKDIFIAGAGNDQIIAQSGKNLIIGGSGDDRITGGVDVDTALFSINSSEVHLVQNANGSITVATGQNSEGTDTLVSVERLNFNDVSVAFDVGAAAGEAYRLYKAAFDRAPDLEGLGYWINSLDDGGTLTGAAGGFIGSPEFQALYGSGSSDRTFVERLYNNVLDRSPDEAGYNYWLGQMGQGMTRESVLINFSESNENKVNVSDLVANGIQYQEWVG